MDVEKSAAAKKTKGKPGSTRANVVFPLGRINAEIKRMFEKTKHSVRKNSSVYLTAYLEYLISYIMLEAFALAVKDKRSRVSEHYITLAIQANPTLKKLFKVSLENFEEYKKTLQKKNKQEEIVEEKELQEESTVEKEIKEPEPPIEKKQKKKRKKSESDNEEKTMKKKKESKRRGR